MNPKDILSFLTPDFSDLLQASFFCVMLAMLVLTVACVSITASPRAWEKKWNRASNAKSGAAQGIDQGGVTDLFHIVATRPEKLAEVMPGMLLIVGLLGTFIGLGLALDKASSILGASSAMDAAGAADGLQNMLGMLKGLGTKFKTSTWGIAGFILMKVWSEVTQFEEKRLAWVIGKVKKESEARNAMLVAVEEQKWNRSVELGNSMTAFLAGAFEKSLLQSSAQHAAQTHALREQQNQIAQSNEATLREIISSQAAAQALLDKHMRAALEGANERRERQEFLLTAFSRQQGEIAARNETTLRELFAEQTRTMNAQQKEDMLENTRMIGLLEQSMQRVADASTQTNEAMQVFTDSTQRVVANMDSAAQRMADGADNVGAAAQNLLGAVKEFETQFKDVLDNVRTDLSAAITLMSDRAADTLAMGSKELSSATEKISASLEQLSHDVTDTMSEVQSSIGKALKIQKDASVEFISTSENLNGAIQTVVENIGKLSTPIADGLVSISTSSRQMNSVSKNMTDGIGFVKEAIEKLSSLADDVKHVNQVPVAMDRLTNALEPMGEIRKALSDVQKQISTRPTAETGIAREINGELNRALSPLNDIQSLLKELSQHMLQGVNGAASQRVAPHASVAPLALSGHPVTSGA
ncbi:hypothetical protein HS961_10545 [Comamonas piscis]|uniref:Uncharacterized protein n=1 Tax=Comamonas piscis TaxID=1562974 RepID=A0A7G5EGV6_9BURK|nr:hypothetical protein [Comamonas piscis]QMV73231.1 hypothetical protein HS961_10545 [Comamonas piscis]WSO36023.1 hypothetical protein VUJ63_10580 [Comamonas piscis]